MTATDTVLGKLDAVAVACGARSAEIEQARRLPPDLAAALIDTGVFRLWVPASLGGAEADLDTALDAIELASRHDGSTGWCVMIGVTTALNAGGLAHHHAQAVFGDPGAVVGGFAMPMGTATIANGGLRVSGRWSWGSGSSHCTTMGGGVRVVTATGERAELADGSRSPFVFFSPTDVALLDTWHVAGLRGTASTDYEVHEAFVPEGRWVDWLNGPGPVETGPLYRFPLFGALAVGVASVLVGLGQRAIDEVVDLAGKKPHGSSKSLAERAVIQVEVARAEAAVRSSRGFLRDVVGACWTRVNYGDELSGEDRRSLRLAATNAAEQCAAAVDRCYHAGGGTSVYETSALQRVFRDAHVATQHGMVAPRTLEPLGRMRLGLPTDTRQF